MLYGILIIGLVGIFAYLTYAPPKGPLYIRKQDGAQSALYVLRVSELTDEQGAIGTNNHSDLEYRQVSRLPGGKDWLTNSGWLPVLKDEHGADEHTYIRLSPEEGKALWALHRKQDAHIRKQARSVAA